MEHALIESVRQILDGPTFGADLDALDELTGAHNAKTGVLRLDVEAKRALRFRHSLSCFIVEIDGLSAVVETHGRRRVDHVLQDVGTILRHTVRASDLVCRLDTERFLLITPRLDVHAAESLGNRIRQRIARHRFPLPEGGALALTASVGVSSVGGPACGAEVLIQRALDAVMAAIGAGGNRVAIG
jgi:diguanylate cyclase (GGDEF)-like protein